MHPTSSLHTATARILRALLACATGVAALGFTSMAVAQNKTGVPEFPGVRNAPDPGTLGYDGWFQQHQPVKIVFAVGTPNKGDLTESLHNAALSIQYLKLKKIAYKIEFVLYGNAVRAADPMNQSTANLGDLMQALHDNGVTFIICYNSMHEVGMAKGDIYPFMQLVPAGILEIARREAQGYAYIRNF